MKKFIVKGLMLMCVALLGFTAKAQQMPELPVDSMVRIGQLPNGLTYYIRHNETPKGQADFYIAQKVGSSLEEDNQRGLAHFLEHMCFNGTKSFPGNSLIDWLESVGVKFGNNLNAYTSIDETVYNISNVPIARESVQDSCLLILHDWANDLLLEDEEIDKERGVIHQEWRRSMVGQMRILENILPIMYPDSRYGYRLPIGTMEVVDNFPYKALRDYYEAWYRPDQQGIIVVGDIDVDRIEGKIKEMFADIEMPANAPERVYFPVPDTPGTIYAMGSDPEQQNAVVGIYFKHDAFPREMKSNSMYLIYKYMIDMAEMMLDNRFTEMQSNPDTPFAQAGANDGNYFVAKTKDAFSVEGVAKGDDILPTVETVYREVLRAKKGFTFGEYERARNEYLSRLEKAYNNRNNRESGNYVREYVRHFIDNEPIPSIQDEYEFINSIAPMIPVEQINQVYNELIGDNNRVFMALLPQKEGLEQPTEKMVEAIFDKVDAEDIQPYVDEMKAEPLIPALPTPGKIVSETHNDQWDATEMTLSNGVKVIVKTTKFKEDEILFNAVAVGGTSVISDDYATELKGLDLTLSQNGLGDYTHSDLQKYLSGKQVYVGADFSDYDREVSGSTTPKDLPTLMELLYMTFTNVTLTDTEAQALINQYSALLANQEKNPGFIFNRDLMKALFQSPRRQMITADDVKNINKDKVLDIAQQMTANAADYLFIFVGNIDLDTFRPLVEQYIATLPADTANITDTIKLDKGLDIVDGTGVDTFTTKMETPQTYVFFGQAATLPYTAKERALAEIAGQILAKRLLDTVREEMGAVYSIGASGSLSRLSNKNATLQSAFPMKPEMKQEVLDYIAGEIAAMEGNIRPEELSKAVEYMVKDAIEKKELNTAWRDAITGWRLNGVDTFNDNVNMLQAITIDDVQNFMKDLRAAGNYRVVVLDPEQ